MNLNRISIGGGLAVLGCSIFALAGGMVVSSGGNPAQAASSMFAGDRKGEAVPPMPSMVEGEPTRGVDGGAELAAIGAASCWEEVEPLNWLGAIRELPDCAVRFEGTGGPSQIALPTFGTLGVFRLQGEYWLEAEAADVNADGQPEYFRGGGLYGYPIARLVSNSQPQAPVCFYSFEEVDPVAGGFDFRSRCLLNSEPFIEIAVQKAPMAEVAVAYLAGWRDLDEDGDLDVLVAIACFDRADSAFCFGCVDLRYKGIFWLENIGMEVTHPLVGDLDGNGSVNSTDLAMLLGGWTGG